MSAVADRRTLERPFHRLTPAAGLLTLAIIMAAVVAAFPLAWMVLSSLKSWLETGVAMDISSVKSCSKS